VPDPACEDSANARLIAAAPALLAACKAAEIVLKAAIAQAERGE